MTYQDVYDKLLEGFDPDDLVNELGIESEELLDRFKDYVKRYYDENYGRDEDES